MPITVNKCSLDNMLKAVLSVGNKEQNQSYPPYIFESQFNTVTSILLSELCKVYPLSQYNEDMLEPFKVFTKIPVQNGVVTLPVDYRNMLGNPSISIKPDASAECGSPIIIDTASEFNTAILKAGCQTRPVVIVPKSEFDYMTTSTYAFPTYDNPIAYFMGTKQLRVCPYDLASVYVLYARRENVYKYGYIMQPDDTYIYDPTQSVESEWTSAAFVPIFNALISLYGAYTRDPDMRDWGVILQKGIL